MMPVALESQVPVPPPAYHRMQARLGAALHIDALTLFLHLHRPPYSGWSAIVSQVALTYTATIVVVLAAWQAHRPDLIRSPKRVLAHLWEDSQL